MPRKKTSSQKAVVQAGQGSIELQTFLPPQEILFARDSFGLALDQYSKSVLPQAILFTGPHMSGKTSMARSLAGVILSQGDQDAFKYLREGNHPDYYEPKPQEKRKSIKIEDLREALSQALIKAPLISNKKVLLIDLDELSVASQNVLLKSLEEPPSYVYFILTASAPETVLPTVMSRVVEYKIKAGSEDEIIAKLSEKVSRDEAFALLSYADGIYGKALSLIEDENFAILRQEALKIFFELRKMSVARLLGPAFDFFSNNKEAMLQIVSIWSSLLADLSVIAILMSQSLSDDEAPVSLATAKATERGVKKSKIAVSGRSLSEIERNSDYNLVYNSDYIEYIANRDRLDDMRKLVQDMLREGGDANACFAYAMDMLLLLHEAVQANVNFQMAVSNALLLIGDAFRGKIGEDPVPQRRL